MLEMLTRNPWLRQAWAEKKLYLFDLEFSGSGERGTFGRLRSWTAASNRHWFFDDNY